MGVNGCLNNIKKTAVLVRGTSLDVFTFTLIGIKLGQKSFKRDLPIERADCVCFMKFSMIGPDLSGAAEPIINYFEILSGCEKR